MAVDEAALVAAARNGDEPAFTALVERYRGELRVHCYRMLGSYHDSEDLVQETLLRAWKNLGGFAGRSSLRAWLYRIATNACLDVLATRARRVLPTDVSGPSAAGVAVVPRTDIDWLQPFPDRLWEPSVPSDTEPDAVVITRETIELAFLAAIQHLPPRQRAVLVLRDLVGWSASQTADAVDGSVASVNSALQRARATLRQVLPEQRHDWSASVKPTAAERAVLRRYMDAVADGDLATVAELLAADVRTTMPPYSVWFAGRDTVLAALGDSWNPHSPQYVGRFRLLPVGANGQPAVAAYLRGPAQQTYHAFAIGVLVIEADLIAEITAFHDPSLFAAFGLPSKLPGDH